MVIANLDLFSMFNLGCVSYATALQKAVVSILMPTIILTPLGLALLLNMCGKLKLKAELENTIAGAFGTIMFLCFVSVNSNIFSIFKCDLLADGKRHLTSDLTVVCFEGEHINFVIVAIFFMLAYTFCVPIGVFRILYRHFHSKRYGCEDLYVPFDEVTDEHTAEAQRLLKDYTEEERRAKVAASKAL